MRGLLADPPTGRPPDYCSQACRRLAEFEVRRITSEAREKRLRALIGNETREQGE
jgi:hypothetical protein